MDATAAPHLDAVVADLLAEAEDDLIGLWEVIDEVEDHTGAAGAALRDRTMAVVAELLRLGLRAGDSPYLPGGYQPWPDQSPHAVLARIATEWDALGRAPNIPDIVWFSR